MKIVCLGDSQTFGLGVKSQYKWTHILNNETEYEIVGRGINGDTTGGMLARFDRDVIREKPAKVLLIGGGNDFIMGCDITVVKANMMSLVHQARAAAIEPLIGNNLPVIADEAEKYWRGVTDFNEVNKKYEALSRWYTDFAALFELQYIDLFHRFMNKTGADPMSYYIEGLHPNERGHRVVADIIREYL